VIAPVPDVAHGQRVSARTVEALRGRFRDAILDHRTFRDEETVQVEPSRLVEICRYLKDEPDLAYNFLTDITATHWLDRDYAYEVAYLLYSLSNNSRVRIKVRLTGAPGSASVRTVAGVWGAADWLEREEWDKVGVVFEGHPNLRRILLPEDWEGHPLRRDYPVEGVGA